MLNEKRLETLETRPQFEKKVNLLGHDSGESDDNGGTYAIFHLTLGEPYVSNNNKINPELKMEFDTGLNELSNYLDSFFDYIEGQPMVSYEVCIVFNTGMEDLPDILQNYHGINYIELAVSVRPFEDERVDFNADEFGVWILTTLGEYFSEYESAKAFTMESVQRAEAFMKKKMDEYFANNHDDY